MIINNECLDKLKPWTQRIREGMKLRDFVTAIVSAAGGKMNSGVLEVEDVYVRLNGGWAVIPKSACDAPTQGFVKEGCIPGMGKTFICLRECKPRFHCVQRTLSN